MPINQVEKIDDLVKIQTVLISVSDKSDLDFLVPGLLKVNPEIKILSTGGTYKKIQEILGDEADRVLVPVSDYTGQPETQGGLVKTLDFKIYLGLLTETYNEAHQEDLRRTDASPIDMVICNLYPFSQTVAQNNCTPEIARGNIDIGGPCMIRAAAKNFIRVAPVVDPGEYPVIIYHLIENKGCIGLNYRLNLAREAFKHVNQYDRAIADYLENCSIEEIHDSYPEIL